MGISPSGIESKPLLHQVDHILRVVLAHKDEIDWLDGANLDRVTSDIRPTVVSLMERCQRAYTPEAVAQSDKEEAVAQLEEILNFYFGKKQVEAWRV